MSLRTFLFGLALGVPAIAAVTPKNIQTPVVFSENRGQYPEGALYGATGRGYSLGIERDRATLRLTSGASGDVVTMRLLGAVATASVQAGSPAGGYQSVFIGSDQTKWAKRLPFYSNVRVNGVYSGIDVNYHGSPDDLEYDFIVAPGADPGQIRLSFDGASGVRLISDGSLELTLPGGKLVNKRPVLYQMVEGKRVEVAGKFALRPEGVAFTVSNYNRHSALVIDPELAYGTYVGRAGGNAIRDMAVDDDGYAYVTGPTCGGILPGNFLFGSTPCPGFVTKLKADGSGILYSAVVGGSNWEFITGIAIENGSAYIGGYTTSTNFPVTSGAYMTIPRNGENGFVTKLSANGDQLVFSTLLGGSASDRVEDIAISNGKVVAVGGTQSTDFLWTQAHASYQYGFLVEFNSAGSAIVFAVPVGTNVASPHAVAVDKNGGIYVTGYQADSTFVTTNGAYRQASPNLFSAFVTKYNADGTTAYSTLLSSGGTPGPAAYAIAVDGGGSAIVTGKNDGSIETTTGVAQSAYKGGGGDAFVLKLNATGTGVIWSTNLGGTGSEVARSIAVDEGGAVYITGETDSLDFPLRHAVATSKSGGRDSILKSIDAGNTWVSTQASLSGRVSSFQSSKHQGATVLYATLSSNQILKSTDGGYSWNPTKCGSALYFTASPAESNNFYTYWESSSDGGETCRTAPFRQVTALAASPTNPEVAYAGVPGQGISITRDGGITWAPYSTNYPSNLVNDNILSIAEHPADQSLIFAVVSSIGVIKSEDAGRSWTVQSLPVFPAGYLYPDWTDRNRVFLAFDTLTRTIDGTTWQFVNIIDGYSNIVVDPTDHSTLYKTGRQLPSKSSDGGRTFMPMTSITNRHERLVAMDPFDHNIIYSAAGASTDGFVTKLDPQGGLLFSTYLGGQESDYPTAIAIDRDENIFVSGYTQSVYDIVTIQSYQPSINAVSNGFLQKYGTTSRTAGVKWNVSNLTNGLFAYRDQSGANNMQFLDVLITTAGQFLSDPSRSTTKSCYLRFDTKAFTWRLQLDDGSWSTEFLPANHQCALGQIGVQGSTYETAVSYLIRPALDWIGTKYSYQRSIDVDGFSTGWQYIGVYGGVTGQGLRYIPSTPCRLVDTRVTTNLPFIIGGPFLKAGSERTFRVVDGGCNLRSFSEAYSLNVTIVPRGPVGYVTLWPTGAPRPFASTLNSLDGRIKANAAIVQAGSNFSFSAYTDGDTDIIIDVNGSYDDDSTPGVGLVFHPLAPCRVADTRNVAGPLGGPSLQRAETRTLPVRSTCNLPSDAEAYALNVTAIPKQTLPFLTMWPAGENRPYTSTLNALVPSTVVANAAVVRAGENGDIKVYAEDATDLVVDINGYFSSPNSSGGLLYYSLSPCRAVDTRLAGFSPALNGARRFDLSGPCGIPSAAAHVINATVVPSGYLGYLSLWSFGSVQPYVSTLNSFDGSIVSNFAVVPSSNGSISAFTTSTSEVILDVSGYFAP